MKVTPERWQQIAATYEAAADLEAAARDRFLSDACAGDESLRREVESLFRHDSAEIVVDLPVWATAAPLFDDDPDLGPGSTLGPYRIEGLLGAGGMGKVFGGTDTRLNRQVAVKVLPAGLGRDRFSDVNQAIAAGYAQFQGCVSGPLEGAMGVHFANGSLFDGSIDIRNPEVLVYEPKNGRLQLAAAEYIVPAEFWDPTHDDYDKPHLMGQLYHYAASPNRYGGGPFYELHVWAVKQNPRGTFADWNPNVSCAEWEDAS